jgi:poly(3-hydroxybutyrate) depolymerase
MIRKMVLVAALMVAAVGLFADGVAEVPASTRHPGSVDFVPSVTIGEFPPIGSLYESLDLSDPYRTVVSGLFREPISVGGVERSYLVYIGEENHQSNPYVCLIPESTQDPRELLELSGWKQIADENGLVLVVPEPQNDRWAVADDIAYLNSMDSQSKTRRWYNVQKGNTYLVGYGDGATLAQAWIMQSPQSFASAATFGRLSLTSSFISATATAGTDTPYVHNGEIPVPMWLFAEEYGESERAVMDHWKTANRSATAEIFSSTDLTEMYVARPNPLSNMVDEQDMVAQTRLTVTRDARAYNELRTTAVWKFLSSVTRTGGLHNSDLRPAYSLEEWNAFKRTLTVSGVVRHWFEFVPEQLQYTSEGGVPLVVGMHGQSTTADAFLWRTEWIRLANERGFIVVFPAGALSNSDRVMPRPDWNIAADPNRFDDYAFLRQMIQEVSARLPVDNSRVYATGQSMGFMTSLAIAVEMEDLITAIAGETGFLLGDENGGPYYTSERAQLETRMPVFVIIGEHDMPPFLRDSTKRINLEYWINRNDAGRYDAPFGEYVDGRYRITTWSNAQNIPLVQYGFMLERPHAPIPSDNTLLYDGFLSRWSNGEGGTLYYMGAEVR